ncbi:type VI secretion protein [Bradyrhizobium sp. 17]|uniref:type VI secretion protein n=1 Tax=Bradyrhizobium sp. 17 TaxID=2782649 RepID=UPI001FFB0CE4|nr:type VI secretion protein [Bradyrhizobium sp. 17]MCK1519519.1 hypothetical protein [Bradyrhizobium sp. 17]
MKSMVLAGALALCLSLTWSAVAEAQFEALAFTVCKKIPTDADRLKCFDAIGPKAKTTEEEAKDPTPVKGKWVYTESKSPIDDSAEVTALLLGEPGEVLLVFRCKENRTEAVFVPDGVFIGASNRVDLLIRIDSNPPETISAQAGTNGRALFIAPPADFMRLLPDNGKLFLRASGFQGRQSDGTFALADVSAARDKVAETCHWSTAKNDRADGYSKPARDRLKALIQQPATKAK